MRSRPALLPITWQWLIIPLLALVAIAPAILMWHWVSTNWVPVPYWDEWHTPGSLFESWYRGTLTWTEMFSLHNEARKFFPRLLYFTLQYFGGWDVRKEMRVVFLLVCGLCLLLLHLLRRTPGATPVSTFVGWIAMTFVCFAPVQIENFLFGVELETLFPGTAVLAAAAINLSQLRFRTKALLNLLLAFVANYTFANGMLVWMLAWPLPSPNESTSRRQRIAWSNVYALAGAISIGCYFIGYQRPSYHPPLASISARFLELVHYFILWEGNYFSSNFADPFFLGVVALSFLLGGALFALHAIYRRHDWRTFYPWLLLGAYACASGAITALGRLGFGLEQALSDRYAAFTVSFYVALVGLYFAIFNARVRLLSPSARTFFLTTAGWLSALTLFCWGLSLDKHLGLLAAHHESRVRCLRTLEWLEPIPDNPDFALLLPFPDAVKRRARFLEQKGVLRLPFVHGALAAAVQKPPPPSDGAHGRIESCDFDALGVLDVKGWAWLPKANRRADCVVIGSENAAGLFKPMSVLETGVKRPDLRDQTHNPHLYRAGFERAVDPANLLPGKVVIKGWAIDLRTQTAWPLESSCR
jgi:hypothetical protein